MLIFWLQSIALCIANMFLPHFFPQGKHEAGVHKQAGHLGLKGTTAHHSVTVIDS